MKQWRHWNSCGHHRPSQARLQFVDQSLDCFTAWKRENECKTSDTYVVDLGNSIQRHLDAYAGTVDERFKWSHAQNLPSFACEWGIKHIHQDGVTLPVWSACRPRCVIKGELVAIRKPADRITPSRQCSKLELIHDCCAECFQLASFFCRKAPRLIVHDTQRSNRHSVLGEEWSAGVEL